MSEGRSELQSPERQGLQAQDEGAAGIGAGPAHSAPLLASEGTGKLFWGGVGGGEMLIEA